MPFPHDPAPAPPSNLIHQPGCAPRVADELRFSAEGRRAVATLAPRLCCTNCGETGWKETTDADGVRRVAKCRCRRAADRADLWNRAELPSKLALHTFATWREAPDGDGPADVAREWLAQDHPGGLMFSGPPGVGKSHLAAAICRELVVERGVAARWANFGHHVSAMKARASGSDVKASPPMVLAAAPALVLDDVSVVATDFERSIADELITRCYDGGGLLIVTTNALSPDQLAEWVGPRCGSRLNEMCRFVKFRAADDRRGRGHKPLPFPPGASS